jgi:hypothetical protein
MAVWRLRIDACDPPCSSRHSLIFRVFVLKKPNNLPLTTSSSHLFRVHNGRVTAACPAKRSMPRSPRIFESIPGLNSRGIRDRNEQNLRREARGQVQRSHAPAAADFQSARRAFSWCGRGDLNPHALTGAATSRLCVCQFRHFRLSPRCSTRCCDYFFAGAAGAGLTGAEVFVG